MSEPEKTDVASCARCGSDAHSGCRTSGPGYPPVSDDLPEAMPPPGAVFYVLRAQAGDAANPVEHESDRIPLAPGQTARQLADEAWEFALEAIEPECLVEYYDADGNEMRS